jgi:hypothetical protein
MFSTDTELGHDGNDRVAHKQVTQRRWSKTMTAKSRIQNIAVRKRAAGMARFFSKSNRDRYRKLASGTISQAEQHRLLYDLAEEMDAFKREARCCLSPAAENSIVSDPRDQM